MAVDDMNATIRSHVELKRFTDHIGLVVIYSVHTTDGRVLRVTVRDGTPLVVKEETQ